MYYLEGFNRCIETIFKLSIPYATDKVLSIQDLKQNYLKFLGAIQPDVWHPEFDQIKYVYKREIIESFIKESAQSDFLTDKESDAKVASNRSNRFALAAVNAGVFFMAEKDIKLYELFDLVINSLYYAESLHQGGGSTSSAIGVIWCANRRSWSPEDLVEFLVHELTHNLLFIDELCYQHYSDIRLLEKAENYAVSTILNIPRPLDKVFHSLVVANEILMLRHCLLGRSHRMNVHPPNQEMIKNCKNTIASIRDLPQLEELVTERFMYILNSIESHLRSL